MLSTAAEVEALIAEGKPIVVAGAEPLLRSLPPGNWIGGTIPYFMGDDGGVTSREVLFVERAPAFASRCWISSYDEDSISRIAVDSPEHGYTILIIPAFSRLHREYALNAPGYPELFFKVIAGWIAGVHLDDLATQTPHVFLGSGVESSSSRAVAMHVELPSSYQALLGIVNIFAQGKGDEIRFPSAGFSASECLINGERRNFFDYVTDKKLDSRLPLVADFCGARVNVSIQALDAGTRTAQFYGPVFDGVAYKMAAPVEHYPSQFTSAIPDDITNPVFTCNCVLNFIYGELEGRRTGSMTGPMTFGEIAYQLLNQTMVYVTVTKED
jgi:hypothetical protein